MERAKLEAAAEAAIWYKNLRETNNEAFLPLFFDRHKIIVLKGGGGSGKSIFAGRFVLERVTSEPGHRWLVVRKVAKTLRESCWAQLRGQLSEHYAGSGYQVNKSDMLHYPGAAETKELFKRRIKSQQEAAAQQQEAQAKIVAMQAQMQAGQASDPAASPAKRAGIVPGSGGGTGVAGM